MRKTPLSAGALYPAFDFPAGDGRTCDGLELGNSRDAIPLAKEIYTSSEDD
jgi:hypothetical protein